MPGRRLLFLVAGALQLMFAPAPASAQVAQGAPAPEFPVVDENGVDLVGGMPQLNRKEVSIGNGDSSLGRAYQFYSGEDNNTGDVQSQLSLDQSQWFTYVSFGTKSAVFSESNGVYTDVQGKGDQLVSSSGGFTYTDRDGTTAVFSTYEPSLGFGYGPRYYINSITAPDGSTTNYYYNQSNNGYQVLNAITTSQGDGLFYSYPGPNSFFSAISAINLGKQYCAVTSTTCTPTSSATGIKYAYADTSFATQSGTSSDQLSTVGEDLSATSPLGRTILYHRETDTENIPCSSCSPPTSWERYQAHLDVNHPVEGTETYTFGKYDSSATGQGDIANRIIQVTKGGLTWTYSWQYTGLHTPWVSGVTVQYPGQGSRQLTLSHVTEWATRPTQDSLTLADGTVRTKTYSWDSYGRMTQATNPEGDYVSYVYDGRGNITSVTRTPKPGSGLAAETTTYGYSSACSDITTCNKPLYMIDPKGNRTDYTYCSVGTYCSGSGELLTETMPAAPNGIRPQKRYSYTQLHASILSSTGQMTSRPLVWKLTSTSECRTTASCSGTADETVTSYTYDANLQLTGTTVKSGDGSLQSSTTKTYDAIGNVVQVEGPLGASDISKNTYDADRELLISAGPDPDGSGPLGVLATQHSYNADGKEISVQNGYAADQSDASLNAMTVTNTLSRTLDSLGRPTLENLLAGSTMLKQTQYSYGTDGRLQCKSVRTNPSAFASPPASACTLGTAGSYGQDRITHTTYDAANEVLQVQQGYGTSIQANYATYTYSPNGNQISVTDADGNLATMTYDGFDRLAQWTFPSKTTAGQVNSADYESYAYDANGNRTSLRKRDGTTIGYSYDALNRMTHKGGSVIADVDYTYDLLGHQLSATFSTGGLGITNSYDALGRLTSATSNMDGTARMLSYQYDAAGNRTQVTHPDGANFTYGFDNLQRLSGVYQGVGTTGPLMTFAYTPDGLLSSRSEAGGSTVGYTWNNIGQLTNQADSFVGGTGNVTWTLGYNPASQITSDARSNDAYAWTGAVSVNRGYAVNGLNQYTTAGPASFTYDANGNLTSDGTNSYVYDGENRLKSATIAGAAVTLSYDPLGRLWRIVKGSSDTRFLYDGNALVLEYDSGGNILNRYVHGSNIAADDPLVWYIGSAVSTAGRRNLHADHEGSIIATSSGSSGANASINTYDEYGIPGSANSGRFQYTGQAYLSELGMYYYKARIYSPTLGRFLQTDPVGYTGGINLYEYVGDDPVDGTDPSGDICIEGPCVNVIGNDVIRHPVHGIVTVAAAAVAVAAVFGGEFLIPAAVEEAPEAATAAGEAEAGQVSTGEVSSQTTARVNPDGKSFTDATGRVRTPSSGGPGAGQRIAPGTRAAEREASGNRCIYCGRQTTNEPNKPNSSQGDHIAPRNPRDGGEPGNNSPENTGNSCASCNNSKSNWDPLKWIQRMF